jgi:hypothetical protein
MSKTLAIIIRCHGFIPINYKRGGTPEEIVFPITHNYAKDFNIQKIVSVSLAKPGETCYGMTNIKEYARAISKIRNNDRFINEENVKNTDDLINYLYNNKSTQIPYIQNLNSLVFGEDKPEIVSLEGTVNKIYQNDPTYEGLGIYYLSDNGFTGQEIEKIKLELQQITEQLTAPGSHNSISKAQILYKLKPFDINTLYFIDFTCFTFINLSPDGYILEQPDINWLNSVMIHHNLRGGKKRKNRKIKKTIKKRII